MPSPVKVLAEEKGIPVFQPASLRPQENQQLVSDLRADVMVVVAYGLILPKAVLDMPRLGCINVHGSLLPRWRGARLFSVRCGRAIPKPASPSCRWMSVSIRVICCINFLPNHGRRYQRNAVRQAG
jgi:hypothetical protein